MTTKATPKHDEKSDETDTKAPKDAPKAKEPKVTSTLEP